MTTSMPGCCAPSPREADDRPAHPRRHPRRGERRRDQRHLPRPRHRHRPDDRSADRPLARFGRRRFAARPRAAARCRGSPKLARCPFAWALSARAGTIDKTVEPDHRAEIKAKLANFVRAPWFAPPFGGPQLTNLHPRRVRGDGAGAEGRSAAARLPAARPVRHRHRFPRLSRAAAAQLAARGDRDRASADPRLPGSGRRRRAGSPTRPSWPSPRARPRASPAPSRRSGSASSTAASTERKPALARPRRLPRPRPAAARRAGRGREGGADRRLGAAQRARSGRPWRRSRSARRGARSTAASSISIPSRG